MGFSKLGKTLGGPDTLGLPERGERKNEQGWGSPEMGIGKIKFKGGDPSRP